MSAHCVTDKQHRMLKLLMGPWVPPLPEVLAPEPGITKSVLDIGCGTGAWFASYVSSTCLNIQASSNRIAEVARAFPECSAVGVDLAPVQTTYVSAGAFAPLVSTHLIFLLTGTSRRIADMNWMILI